ncbi:MAG: peptide MFS transporter [Pirellulales bacterium]
MSNAEPQRETLFGHPAGLYTLFFAEMWERFSYYGMRALLVFYMTKGFLGYKDSEAITVYGAYTALVYMTPFFGGMLADRLLGARRAVVLGGALMALGQLMLTIQYTWAFFGGLALLIAGNGFFKPNISTMVGSLYEQHSAKRDGGFTIFYMGINLGAAMSPLLCGYIGETYGWHWGFGLATIGMLTGLAVFVLPGIVTQLLILLGALAASGALFYFHPINPISIAINVFVGISLLAAAMVAVLAIQRGGLPKNAGAPPSRASENHAAARAGLWPAVLLGTALSIPVFALLVSGFGPLRESGHAIVLIPDSTIKSLAESENSFAQTAAVVAEEASKPAGLVLTIAGLVAAIYLVTEAFRLQRVARERMFVVFVLFFFIMLFWAFFEQAGSSVNLFTDRNVDRVIEPNAARVVGEADVGKTIALEPTQEQLGYSNGDQLFTMDRLDELRSTHAVANQSSTADNMGAKNEEVKPLVISWKVAPDNKGMRIARRVDEIPASLFQSINAIYIMVFGLVFTGLWGMLAARGLEPSTPFKFALGLLQLGLGFVSFWWGSQEADARGIVNIGWLLLGYLLHTTGELCISPVGLAMVTRLSPKHLVSTVMGAFFLSTAFSQYLAAIIAQFTSVKSAAGRSLPAPIDTVHVYGDVFGRIAVAAIISSVICFALVPLLKRWMHEESEQ